MRRPPSRLSPLAALLFGACQAEGPPSDAPVDGATRSHFTEITRASGIDFVHDIGFDASFFMPESIGAGGALFDYDGDGDLDLYLIDSGPHRDDDLGAPNRLYRREGDGRYVDRTEVSGAGESGYGMGAAVGDVDGDGDLDLYVTNFGPDRLLLNDGRGGFQQAEPLPGGERWSTAACWADFERDGDLDLFVVTYVLYQPPKSCTDRAGRPEYCGPAVFRGLPDLLYRNDGSGRLAEAGAEAGIGDSAGRGLGIACADLDGDGWTDVYVANDGERNELWLNRGDGRFEDRALLLGAAVNLMGEPEASMGVALGDVDGDLDLDLFLSHLDRETNTLYRNLGAGGFEDVTGDSAAGAPSYPHTGFGTAFLDAELDGDLDLLVVNGRVRRGDLAPATDPPPDDPLRHYAQPNLLLLNDGSGGFTDHSAVAGDLCTRSEVSRGLMIGDLDHDGDLDAVVTQCAGPARVYRNDWPDTGSWASVLARIGAGGSYAEGTRIVAEAAGRAALRVQTAAGSYLSAMGVPAHFGLGPARRIDRLTLTWPDGGRLALLDLPVDRRFELWRRGTG